MLERPVFAQQAARPSPQQTTATTQVVQIGLLPIPVRNNASGRSLRAVMDTVERLLLPVDFSDPFSFRRLSAKGERQIRWRRALDTIETIARFVDSDTLAKAYYFYGKGMIFQDMAWSGMFIRDSAIIFARNAIRYFETYIQNRIGDPAPVYESLAMLYFDFLSDPNTALRRINRSLALDPRRVYAHISKATILRTMGRHAEACEALRRARQIESLQIIDMMISSFRCP